jgi:hypothetical protein
MTAKAFSRVAASRVGSVRGMARKPIVGGNWKCNPATASSLPGLVSNFDGCAQYTDKCDVYVCPSNLHVAIVKDQFKPGIMVAPQNCNFKVPSLLQMFIECFHIDVHTASQLCSH